MTTHRLNYYAPLAIGIDRFFTEIEGVIKGNTTYPPHNVLKDGDDKYTIELAVAGLSKDEITIETVENTLKISAETAKDEREYVHKGISSRSFTRTFTLAEYVEVKDAKLENGILRVSLERNVPEAKKPRSVTIA